MKALQRSGVFKHDENILKMKWCDNYLQTEYKYCYDLVLHYVLHYLHKEQAKCEPLFYFFLN